MRNELSCCQHTTSQGVVAGRVLTWLETQERLVLPTSAPGQAMSYYLKQWTKLACYVEDGQLTLEVLLPWSNTLPTGVRWGKCTNTEKACQIDGGAFS
nr:transposase [Alicyclobacillus hesperidum]